MKIAFDGGAFQQGIAAGIYNVAVGFLNAAVAKNSDLKVILIADRRFGDMKPDLLSALKFNPEIMFTELESEPRQTGLLTNDPRVRFVVDGKMIVPEEIDNRLVYKGPVPRDFFWVTSRASRPSDVFGSPDRRMLGIFVSDIVISCQKMVRRIDLDRLGQQSGFQGAEPNGQWTSGKLEIPLEVFTEFHNEEITVEFRVGHNKIPYRLLGGAFDAATNDVLNNATRLRRESQLQLLGANLRSRGVQFYFCNHFIPLAIPGIKKVAWVYDLIPFMFPKFFHADAVANFSDNLKLFLEAEHVFCISENTRQDLAKYAHQMTDRSTAVGIDCDPIFKRVPPPQMQRILSKYGLGGKLFFICVATLEPRKNHIRLIQAFAEARLRSAEMVELVLVGKPGWDYHLIAGEANRLGISKAVHILHSVPSDDLAALYGSALALVYVSLYEGFGLPILEAMRCGTAVITSNCSSMPEIAGNAALLVNPESNADISAAMERILSNEDLRHRLIREGDIQAQLYSWNKVASNIMTKLRELANARS